MVKGSKSKESAIKSEKKSHGATKLDKASRRLLKLLNNNDGYHDEVWELLESINSSRLEVILTTNNTEKMLTTWGNDPHNDRLSFANLNRIPKNLLKFHAKSILSHRYDVMEGYYGWSEKYPSFWQESMDIMIKVCPQEVSLFLEETMVPNLKKFAEDYQKWESDYEQGQCSREPSLVQNELADITAMIKDIADIDLSMLLPYAETILEILNPFWSKLNESIDCYEPGIFTHLHNELIKVQPHEPGGGSSTGGSTTESNKTGGGGNQLTYSCSGSSCSSTEAAAVKDEFEPYSGPVFGQYITVENGVFVTKLIKSEEELKRLEKYYG